MTIKNQFFVLFTTIISIPILCLIIILTNNYLKSSDRLLLDGYKEIRKMDEMQFSDQDWDTLSLTIESLPLDIQAVLLSEDNTVIVSSIPDFQIGHQIAAREMWELVNGASDKYFYQITSPPLSDRKVSLITRTPRNRKKTNTRKIAITVLVIIILFVCVFIVLIFILSNTIFNSIIVLKEKTKQIADGNLSVEIETKEIKGKNKRNEITSILESLEVMRQSLVEAQDRKNKFIMGISHDLRTPVAIIKGYTEAITDGIITEPDEIKTSLELIGTKTTQLEAMIDTLINFMKLNNSEIRQNLIPSSITDLISDFAKESKVTANVFKRNIIINLDFSQDVQIPLDKQLALRAFQNLFSNALRYTRDGDDIEIHSYIENSTIYLEIRDTGIGMEKKDVEHIFDLFYRATNSRREEGLGIGLSVVKSIIETHGWNIFVESEIEKGSSFIIEIPFTPQNK